MKQEELQDYLNQIIGLDDTFSFHCTACGKCCVQREDIILSPNDLFRIAKELHLTTREVIKKYCNCYIGPDSQLPLVRLLPTGEDLHCPFLNDSKCFIQKAKPSVCAMFPLGRMAQITNADQSKGKPEFSKVQYIFQDVGCGDKSETHTVREWLEHFHIPLEDMAFQTWLETQIELSKIFQKLMPVLIPPIQTRLWSQGFDLLYADYDTELPFLPQLKEHTARYLNIAQTLCANVTRGPAVRND